MELKSYCDHVSDEEIRKSKRPEGYCREVHQWPPGAWQKWEWHIYRIKLMAYAMHRSKKWIGPLVIIYDDSIDGNHRVRAVKYCLTNFGMKIDIPEPVDKRKKPH